MLYDFEFNGETCADHNALVRQRPNIPVPQEEVEKFRVAGRDGVLTGKRYLPPMDFYIPINFKMRDPEMWMARFRDIRQWLTGSGTLRQSDDDEYFLKIISVQIEESERIIRKYGRFTAHFTADPYYYRLDGLEEYALTDSRIKNNRYEVSHPAYIVTGSGTVTLKVNGNTAKVTVDGTTIVDTDRMITYTRDDHQLQNTRLQGDYEKLYLKKGTNTFSGSGITIIPNWRSR